MKKSYNFHCKKQSYRDRKGIAISADGSFTDAVARLTADSVEPGCENFVSGSEVCRIREDAFNVGCVNKYTIVIRMEGEDPECVDEIVGGSVQFSMKIEAVDDDDTSLFEKFVMDIGDWLSDDKPIGAAGEDAPDYYKDQEINWDTRLNK